MKVLPLLEKVTADLEAIRFYTFLSFPPLFYLQKRLLKADMADEKKHVAQQEPDEEEFDDWYGSSR